MPHMKRICPTKTSLHLQNCSAKETRTNPGKDFTVILQETANIYWQAASKYVWQMLKDMLPAALSSNIHCSLLDAVLRPVLLQALEEQLAPQELQKLVPPTVPQLLKLHCSPQHCPWPKEDLLVTLGGLLKTSLSDNATHETDMSHQN